MANNGFKFPSNPAELFASLLDIATVVSDTPVSSVNNAVVKLTGYNILEMLDVNPEIADHNLNLELNRDYEANDDSEDSDNEDNDDSEDSELDSNEEYLGDIEDRAHFFNSVELSAELKVTGAFLRKLLISKGFLVSVKSVGNSVVTNKGLEYSVKDSSGELLWSKEILKELVVH